MPHMPCPHAYVTLPCCHDGMLCPHMPCPHSHVMLPCCHDGMLRPTCLVHMHMSCCHAAMMACCGPHAMSASLACPAHGANMDADTCCCHIEVTANGACPQSMPYVTRAWHASAIMHSHQCLLAQCSCGSWYVRCTCGIDRPEGNTSVDVGSMACAPATCEKHARMMHSLIWHEALVAYVW